MWYIAFSMRTNSLLTRCEQRAVRYSSMRTNSLLTRCEQRAVRYYSMRINTPTLVFHNPKKRPQKRAYSIDSVWLLLAQFLRKVRKWSSEFLRKVRKWSSEFLRKVRKPYHKLFPFQQLLRIVGTKNQGAVRGVREYFVILQTLCFFRLLYII